MALQEFNGQLNLNKIYDGTIRKGLFNMILAQRIYNLDNLSPNKTLYDMFRAQAGMYGDSWLGYYADVTRSRDFIAGINNGVNQNVLETHRPNDVTVQRIVVNKVRQIEITINDFLTKQGFEGENAYSQLMGVFQTAMEKTK